MTTDRLEARCRNCGCEIVTYPDGSVIDLETDLRHICVGTSAAVEPTEKTRRTELLRASDVEPQSIEWIWRGWLARGELHILDGDMEQGKTTIVMDLVTRFTRGDGWPDAQ